MCSEGGGDVGQTCGCESTIVIAIGGGGGGGGGKGGDVMQGDSELVFTMSDNGGGQHARVVVSHQVVLQHVHESRPSARSHRRRMVGVWWVVCEGCRRGPEEVVDVGEIVGRQALCYCGVVSLGIGTISGGVVLSR